MFSSAFLRMSGGCAYAESVKMNHRLFIYGTLKRGQSRADFLDGQNFIGEAQTTQHYRLFRCGAFPSLVEASRNDVDLPGISVEGELWEVDDDCLQMLDWIEAVNSGLFKRVMIGMIDGSEAEVYLFKGSVEGLEDCGAKW
jgi:gamma-glutamylcyclotransferase (GGCT)/AIG2-like uncharacterized protein YtfP